MYILPFEKMKSILTDSLKGNCYNVEMNKDDKEFQYVIGYSFEDDIIKLGFRTSAPLYENVVVVPLTDEQVYNFNEEIYNKKIAQLTMRIKKIKQNKKLKDLEKDFK